LFIISLSLRVGFIRSSTGPGQMRSAHSAIHGGGFHRVTACKIHRFFGPGAGDAVVLSGIGCAPDSGARPAFISAQHRQPSTINSL
jgi:hypothetical protein